MLHGEKRLAAAFYISREMGDVSLEQLARAAEMDAMFTSNEHPEPTHGRWAGMEDCYARLDSLPSHHCFQIYFWLRDFDFGNDDEGGISNDRAWPVVETFRRACDNLRTEVGLIVSHLDQANPDYLLGDNIYGRVLGMDGYLLFRERVGLLYLNEDFARDVLQSVVGDRDIILMPDPRCLVFAGKGSGRWH